MLSPLLFPLLLWLYFIHGKMDLKWQVCHFQFLPCLIFWPLFMCVCCCCGGAVVRFWSIVIFESFNQRKEREVAMNFEICLILTLFLKGIDLSFLSLCYNKVQTNSKPILWQTLFCNPAVCFLGDCTTLILLKAFCEITWGKCLKTAFLMPIILV